MKGQSFQQMAQEQMGIYTQNFTSHSTQKPTSNGQRPKCESWNDNIQKKKIEENIFVTLC